ASRNGSVRTQLYFALEHGVSTPRIHHQQDEVCGLSADLKPHTAGFQSHHGGRTPRAAVVFASAASHGTAAITTANNKRSFEHRGINDYALGLVDQVLRNVFGNIHDFPQHR